MLIRSYYWVVLWLLLANTGQAQEQFCEVTDSLGAKTAFFQAQQAYRAADLAQAANLFEQARIAYQVLGCPAKVYLMRRNALKVYISASDNQKFHQVYQQAQQEVKNVEDQAAKIQVGRLYLLKSKYYLQKKQLDSAKTMALLSAKNHKKIAAWKYYIRTQNELAIISYYQQDYEAMEAAIDAAFDAYKAHSNDKKLLQRITELYGSLYYKTGAYEEALERTMSALEITSNNLKSRSDTLMLARMYNNIGLYYIELGDLYQAEDYCKNALQLFKQLDQQIQVATTYLNLGEFFSRQGKLQEALEFYEAGELSLQKVQNQPLHQIDRSYINIHNGIGDVATKLGRFEAAKAALDKNQLIHQREPAKQDETYNVLGNYYQTLQQHQAAIENYQNALVIQEEYYGKEHPLLAKTYYSLGQVAQAQTNQEQANAYYDEAILRLGLPTNLDSLLALFQAPNVVFDQTVLLQILAAKAQVYLANQNLEKAFAAANAAVALLEKMRNGFKEEGSKLFIVQKMIPTYELAIELALSLYKQQAQQSYLETAFQLVEKSKSILLLDALKTENARNFGNIPEELLEEERRLARSRSSYEKLLFEAKLTRNEPAIAKSEQQLLALKRAAKKLQDKLESAYPKYYELKYQTRLATLKATQASLDANTALLEFFEGSKHTYVFSIYQDTVWVNSVERTAQLDKTIKGLRTSLTDTYMLSKQPENNYLLFAKQARILYQQYLATALRLDQLERVIFIPDGLLNYIPLEVLLTSKPDYTMRNFKTLPYLIKIVAVSYHYSATLKLFDRSSPRTNGKLLAMASAYDKSNIQNTKGLLKRERQIRLGVSDLPGAKREVEQLEAIFQGSYFYGKAANERTFKQFSQSNEFSVLHLAMHGLVDAQEPAYSNLVFSYSADTTEDDLLHAYELNLLELEPDLVVLSACETGFGKYERGEGVVSLGRGFMYAGAPSLVMTLWPINDNATSQLIQAFYAELSNGLPKDEAMQKAKVYYLENAKGIGEHPFFWASFINLGNCKAITLKKAWTWGQLLLLAGLLILTLSYLWPRIMGRKSKES